MMNETEQLAREFSKVLRRDIGTMALLKVIELNAAPGYAGCCASHDYCDANMSMLEALENLGLASPVHRGDLVIGGFDLCNNAWDKAKAERFYL